MSLTEQYTQSFFDEISNIIPVNKNHKHYGIIEKSINKVLTSCINNFNEKIIDLENKLNNKIELNVNNDPLYIKIKKDNEYLKSQNDFFQKELNILKDKLSNPVIVENAKSDEKNNENINEEMEKLKDNYEKIIKDNEIKYSDKFEGLNTIIINLNKSLEEQKEIIYGLSNEVLDLKKKNINASKNKENENKQKTSSLLVEKIKIYYYNGNKDILPFMGNDNVSHINYDINNCYGKINKNKAELIVKYYELYYNYMKNKKNDEKLKFTDFIKYNNYTCDINRHTEKSRRSYEFIKELLGYVKDIRHEKLFEKMIKLNTLIKILSKCRLSVDKLYKIRKNDYNELIEFLNPLIVENIEKDINHHKELSKKMYSDNASKNEELINDKDSGNYSFDEY